MGLFGGIGSARFAGRSPFVPPGVEVLAEVVEVQCFASQNPEAQGATFFKIGFRVLAVAFDHEVYDPQTFKAKDNPTVVVPRPGTQASHIITLPAQTNAARFGLALGDIKNFATAAYRAIVRQSGADPDAEVRPEEFTEGEIENLYAANQPCAGLTLGLRTSGKATKKNTNQNAFTQHYWEEGPDGGFAFSMPEQGRITAAA